MPKKRIAWESWNTKEIELVESQAFNDTIEEEVEMDENAMISGGLTPLISQIGPVVIHTPFGMINAESALKPSDRWECWLGYTNFDISHMVSDRIKKTEGVEALKIMGRYTFCIGIGKMFSFSNIRRDIENAICK